MKKFALLTLLATPAFAHQLPFSDPKFLKLTSGDAKSAQQLSWFCDASGMKRGDCLKKLSGTGNLQQEAVLRCEKKQADLYQSVRLPSFTSNEHPGARAHLADGTDWHSDYQREGNGRWHRHPWMEDERTTARDQVIRDVIVTWRQTTDGVSGDMTVTKGVSHSVGLEQGIVSEVISFLKSENIGTTTEMSKKSGIPEIVLKEAYTKGQLAFNNPAKAGLTPSVICYKAERDCRNVPVGQNATNPSYDPDADKEKKDDKKGAENPPKSEDDVNHDVPDIISNTGGDSWAGNEASGTPDEAIATPTMEDIDTVSAMEKCVKKETKRLVDTLDSTTVDPNAGLEVEVDGTKTLLKFGYCDEQIMGHAACQAMKFKKDSVVAVTIIQERKEAAQQALLSFKNTGVCNAQALGREFCQAQKKKWETTPASVKDLDLGKFNPKPIRPGPLPRINP